MRIAITADPYLPVPPRLYGGIERVIDFLVRGLVDRGHEVTLFAHPESQTPARLIPYGRPPHFTQMCRATELWQVGASVWRKRFEFDLVHSFGRLAAMLPVLSIRSLPKLQSYQRDGVPWKSIQIARVLAGKSIRFTACSTSVYRGIPALDGSFGAWHTIFNGVDVGKYAFQGSVPPDAPLVFLGRLEPIKGAHHAIAIARAADRRLRIAGNQVPDAKDYFDSQIAPYVDGAHVQYLGPVDDRAKSVFLSGAAALLMPIEWEEPFGIVMAEAFACGTPVIGFARGSVPEVVQDGVNGYICRDIADAVAAVKRLDCIDRSIVRKICEERFSSTVIVRAYESLYRDVCGLS